MNASRNGEARFSPRDLLSLEEGLEHLLAEQLFERPEVDVLRNGVEDSVAGEDAERKDAMEVRV